jgi:hypothetical protein
MTNPTTPYEWQNAMDIAHGALTLESARQYVSVYLRAGQVARPSPLGRLHRKVHRGVRVRIRPLRVHPRENNREGATLT